MMKLPSLPWIAGFAVLLLAIVAVRADRVRARGEADLLEERSAAVRTARVGWGSAETLLTVPGVVEAAQGIDLAPEVTSSVVESRVEPGDRVLRGELLLRLDGTRLAAELEGSRAEAAAAEAEATSARRTLEVEEARTRRDRNLFEEGAVSREALDLSEASLARARAAARVAGETVRRTAKAVEVAEDRLADTELRAPWNGEVVDVALDPGDLATAGRPALRLVRGGGYRIDLRLPQEAAMEVVAGGPATVEADGRRLEAAVSRIGSGLDPSGLAIVEVDVPARPLGRADGASVRVTLRLRSSEGLTVPVLALLEATEGPIVYRLAPPSGPEGEGGEGGDRVEAVSVEILQRGTDRVVVEGALREGDRVVTEHPSVLMLLSDGVRVQSVDGMAGPEEKGQ